MWGITYSKHINLLPLFHTARRVLSTFLPFSDPLFRYFYCLSLSDNHTCQTYNRTHICDVISLLLYFWEHLHWDCHGFMVYVMNLIQLLTLRLTSLFLHNTHSGKVTQDFAQINNVISHSQGSWKSACLIGYVGNKFIEENTWKI